MILAGACSSREKEGKSPVGAPDMAAAVPAALDMKAELSTGMTTDKVADAMSPDPGKPVPEVGKGATAGQPERAKTPNSALLEYEKDGAQLIPAPAVILAKSVEGKDAATLTAGDFGPKLQALSAGLAGLSTKAGEPGAVFTKVFPEFKAGAGNWKSLPARATVSVMEIKDSSVLGLLVRVTPEGFKRCAGGNTAKEGFFGIFVTRAAAGPQLTLHEFEKLELFGGFDATVQVAKLPNADAAAALITFKTSNLEKVIADQVSKGLYCKPESDPSEYARTYSTVLVFEKGAVQAMRTIQMAESSTTVGRTSRYAATLSWISTDDGVFLLDTVVEHNEYPDTTGESETGRTVCSKIDYLFDAGGNGFLRQLTLASVEKLRAVKGYEKVSKDVEHGDAKSCQALLKN